VPWSVDRVLAVPLWRGEDVLGSDPGIWEEKKHSLNTKFFIYFINLFRFNKLHITYFNLFNLINIW